MTKRIAIFVEGLTEQEFTAKLLIKIAGSHGVTLDIHEQRNGSLNFVELRPQNSAAFYVLIGNCNTDNQVKSQINNNYESLKAKNYSLIIGLRDVYPLTKDEIPDLQRLLNIGLPTGNPPVHIHLTIMEVEAWFLEEISHYQRIHKSITSTVIATCGFDSNVMSASDIHHPTDMLNAIYKTAGMAYTIRNKKKTKQIMRTINALSYNEICSNVRTKDASLNGFIKSIEEGLF